MVTLKHRVRCGGCHGQFDLNATPACPTCGSTDVKRVKPTAGDVHAVEADVFAVLAEVVWRLRQGTTLHRDDDVGRRLLDLTRELELTRDGLICR